MGNPWIQVISISAASFQPLVIPWDCNVYFLKNNGADTLYMRTDPNDALTEDSLVANGWESINLPYASSAWATPVRTRYKAGQILYYVKGSGPLMLKCWA